MFTPMLYLHFQLAICQITSSHSIVTTLTHVDRVLILWDNIDRKRWVNWPKQNMWRPVHRSWYYIKPGHGRTRPCSSPYLQIQLAIRHIWQHRRRLTGVDFMEQYWREAVDQLTKRRCEVLLSCRTISYRNRSKWGQAVLIPYTNTANWLSVKYDSTETHW